MRKLQKFKKKKKKIKMEDEDIPKRLRKIMIVFQDAGIAITAYDVNSIEKDVRFIDKPPYWEFGITINKGIEKSQYINKTDLSLWYIKEEIRDQKWTKLIEALEKEGVSVIKI